MSEKIVELISTIRDHRDRLDRIVESLETALVDEIVTLGRTERSALIVAGLLENYYTCLETIFLRVSQFFDNNLDPARWHSDLLEKMGITIEGVRERAVSKENYPRLLELQKIRHFKRYYFDLEYDWDRLDYLVVILRKAAPIVAADLDRFEAFLRSI